MSPAPKTSTTVETLTRIWESVLQTSPINPDDNFFDLGGDSALALQLFNEIANLHDRELPPVMIYHAPTISALAGILDEPTTPRFPPLALLKDGTKDPPVFITHGLGGSLIDFYHVVKHMETPRAVYGMQGKGIDGVEEPFDRVEDMAQYSLDAVRKIQPHGPYLLVGFSLGGLVTFEMARRLRASQEKVALLAMLDSYPHMRYLSFGQRALLKVQQRQRSLWKKLSYRAVQPLPGDGPLSPVVQRCRESAYRALENYQPSFYPGKITFVRAAISTTFSSNPAAVWGHLAEDFAVDTVPGDHLGIMTTHYAELAALISRYLRESLPA
jgi:thioesterase domain-containing protein/acyl carrier protein